MPAESNNTDNAEVEDLAKGSEKVIPEADPVDIDLLSELHQARKDRVAQIKAAIEAGQYDSDELLNAALERMLDKVVPEEEDTAKEES